MAPPSAGCWLVGCEDAAGCMGGADGCRPRSSRRSPHARWHDRCRTRSRPGLGDRRHGRNRLVPAHRRVPGRWAPQRRPAHLRVGAPGRGPAASPPCRTAALGETGRAWEGGDPAGDSGEEPAPTAPLPREAWVRARCPRTPACCVPRRHRPDRGPDRVAQASSRREDRAAPVDDTACLAIGTCPAPPTEPAIRAATLADLTSLQRTALAPAPSTPVDPAEPATTQKTPATAYFPEGLPPEYLRRWRA